MKYAVGNVKKEDFELYELQNGDYEEKDVLVTGFIYSIRDMGEVVFIILRKRDGLLQCVVPKEKKEQMLKEVREEACAEIFGKLVKEERAVNGEEIRIKKMSILSSPKEALPIPIGKWKLNTSLETKMDLRPVSLRNIRERAKFKIQEGIVRGFREYLYKQGFTEIHTPKLNAKGAEGGSNIFKLEYFNKKAVLAQSPQLYKQMMVGVYERVFETGPVFRAEKHHTKRHLNEYTSMDFEMGFISSFEDIIEMETGFLIYTMELLKEEYKKDLELLQVKIPKADRIPIIKFQDAKELISKKYNRPIKSPYDLEPEEEELIGAYFKEKEQSDFVFVTHYPSKKRPFYTMDDLEDDTVTLSFDLLFRGIEVTTGGQRIHDYRQLLEKIEKRNISTEGLETYLMAFRYGMPPHGGLGIGLERFTMKLLSQENVRETSLFPRDLKRLEP